MRPGASPSAAVNGAAAMIIVALLIAGLYAGRDLLIPLALAGLLSFVLAPLVHTLVRWRVPQGLAVLAVVGGVLAISFAGLTVAGHQMTQLLEELPSHEANLRDKARFIHRELGGAGVWQRAAATIHNIEREVRDPQSDSTSTKIEVAQSSDQPLVTIFEYTRLSVPSLVTAALALLLTIFILLQYRDLRDRAVRLMGTTEMARSTQAFDEAGADLAHFLLLQLGLNASFGIYVGVALWAFGIPSAGLWGAMAAIMRIIPYVGVFIAAAFPLALGAMVDPGWGMLVKAAAVYLAGELLVGQIVEPLLFGSQTRLSPMAILVGTIFWTTIWGPIGLILAVPLTLAVVVMGQRFPRLAFLRVLLGNEPALQPREQLYHQLLAGEPLDAAEAAEQWIVERTFENYLDEVTIPALRIASDDHRRGVFGRSQGKELIDSISTYTRLVKQSLEFTREEQADRPGSTAGGRTATVLVLAGRGSIDVAAGELVAEAIRLSTDVTIRRPSLGGLTGISAAAEVEPNRHPDIIVLISLGALTPAQFKLLLGRAMQTFPDARVVVGSWDDHAHEEQADAPHVRYAASVQGLLGSVSRIVGEMRGAEAPRTNSPSAAA